MENVYLNKVFLKPGRYVNPLLQEYRAKSDIPKEVFIAIDYAQQIYEGYCSKIHNYNYRNLRGITNRGTRKSMMAPKFLLKDLASLIHTGNFQIIINGSEEIKNLFEKFSKDNDLERILQQMTESGLMAVGGYASKMFIDFDLHGHKSIYLDSMTHKNFIPISYAGNNIKSGAFISDSFKVGDFYYQTVETHEQETIVEGKVIYKIVRELYKAKNWNEKGEKVPWETLYPSQPSLEIFENMEGHMLFNYTRSGISNAMISHSILGTPITADSIEAFEVLDTMYDTFFKEGLYGKISIDVPESALKIVIDRKTGREIEYFDANTEVYKAYKQNSEPGMSNAPKINAVPLRIDSYVQAIDVQLKIVAGQMGISPDSVSFDGKSMKTATEVITENSKTFKTKVNFEQRLKESYERLVDMVVSFARINNMISHIPDYEVEVIFDDSIIIDDQKDFDNNITMHAAGALSTYTLLKENKNMDEKELEEELKRIEEEKQAMFDDSSDDSDEAEWIENYLMNNPDSNEVEARKKYNEQLEG